MISLNICWEAEGKWHTVWECSHACVCALIRVMNFFFLSENTGTLIPDRHITVMVQTMRCTLFSTVNIQPWFHHTVTYFPTYAQEIVHGGCILLQPHDICFYDFSIFFSNWVVQAIGQINSGKKILGLMFSTSQKNIYFQKLHLMCFVYK